jgi:hypothetical protein
MAISMCKVIKNAWLVEYLGFNPKRTTDEFTGIVTGFQFRWLGKACRLIQLVRRLLVRSQNL